MNRKAAMAKYITETMLSPGECRDSVTVHRHAPCDDIETEAVTERPVHLDPESVTIALDRGSDRHQSGSQVRPTEIGTPVPSRPQPIVAPQLFGTSP